MTEYNVTIKIAEENVKQFNDQGWKLCVAFGFSSSKEGPTWYNVIAYSTCTNRPYNRQSSNDTFPPY